VPEREREGVGVRVAESEGVGVTVGEHDGAAASPAAAHAAGQGHGEQGDAALVAHSVSAPEKVPGAHCTHAEPVM
jgi:hypothetical protein